MLNDEFNFFRGLRCLSMERTDVFWVCEQAPSCLGTLRNFAAPTLTLLYVAHPWQDLFSFSSCTAWAKVLLAVTSV